MTMTDELVTEARKGGPCAELGDRCRAIEAASGCFCAAVADRIEALTAEHNATLARLAGAVTREIALTADNARLRAAMTALHKQALMLRGDQSYREFARAVEKQARAALNTGKEPSHD